MVTSVIKGGELFWGRETARCGVQSCLGKDFGELIYAVNEDFSPHYKPSFWIDYRRKLGSEDRRTLPTVLTTSTSILSAMSLPGQIRPALRSPTELNPI